FAMKQFANVATNGALWRFSLSKAHLFNKALHKFQNSIPVIKNWSKYKELPQIKKDLYKELENMEGVRYE
ncbi:MAG: DUF3390 domain-containing protein, partial [Campylobacter sp.]|nr:DUF3390 domain-containing protein [Campylobacter sp.]